MIVFSEIEKNPGPKDHVFNPRIITDPKIKIDPKVEHLVPACNLVYTSGKRSNPIPARRLKITPIVKKIYTIISIIVNRRE